MRLSRTIGALGSTLITACTSITPATVPVPKAAPDSSAIESATVIPLAPQPPLKRAPQSGSWNFAYAPGTYTYTLVTNATIAPVTDTTQVHVIPRLTQDATISISATGDVQVLQPLAVTSAYCDSNASLTTRAQELIPKLPSHLIAGDRWRDSTTTSGCRGMIPAESTVISNYLVIGDTTFGSTVSLHIHRADSLTANGKGAEGQHRILVTAKGTGDSNIFLDVVTGRLLGSNGVQTSVIDINTSGRPTLFLQHVTESISIAGSQ